MEEMNGSSNKDSRGYSSVPQNIDPTPASNSMEKKTSVYLKSFSLVTLTIQNALLALSLRHGTTRPGDRFHATTDYVGVDSSRSNKKDVLKTQCLQARQSAVGRPLAVRLLAAMNRLYLLQVTCDNL
ncbi:hypothetical protein LSTR_LSTR004186 [Laodelphax striatellus]|uniref:Uncharacterized protein n=1 Tax=Laodelphax striatellus TaxID=195883 RepID=A0A482XA86_LAOST|nr:hypothetical protein LSTR_LSTR004186 [Laodelphax striatellus]